MATSNSFSITPMPELRPPLPRKADEAMDISRALEKSEPRLSDVPCRSSPRRFLQAWALEVEHSP